MSSRWTINRESRRIYEQCLSEIQQEDVNSDRQFELSNLELPEHQGEIMRLSTENEPVTSTRNEAHADIEGLERVAPDTHSENSSIVVEDAHNFEEVDRILNEAVDGDDHNNEDFDESDAEDDVGGFEPYDELENRPSLTDDEPDSDEDSDEVFLSELRDWAVGVTHKKIGEMLHLFKRRLPFLPKDPRTLLKTVQVYDIRDVSGGEYHHFGLSHGIISKLDLVGQDKIEEIEELYVQMNLDGLPLYKSSSIEFWPILCRLVETVTSEPFIVGLYCGESKPLNLDFLDFYVREMEGLHRNGLVHKGQNFTVHQHWILCDSPARSFVKAVKAHNGHYGCDKCVIRGEWVDHRMTFPDFSEALRTDEDFATKRNRGHHNGDSPLERLGIGMISMFPLDYMHLICLGIVKRLLVLWVKGARPHKLGHRAIRSISEMLIQLRPYLPSEFVRTFRPLKHVAYFKATEFRTFLLYAGPVVLKSDFFESTRYDNFMLLSCAVTILVDPRLCQRFASNAKVYLTAFVRHYMELYPPGHCIYSFHMLAHLSDEVKKYGSLDNFSCFAFENYLGKIKRMVKGPYKPLQQVIRRMSERPVTDKLIGKRSTPKPCGQHENGPLPMQYDLPLDTLQYESVELSEYTVLRSRDPDNCARIGGRSGILRNFLVTDDRIFVVFQPYRDKRDLYTYPMDSTQLGIDVVSQLSPNLEVRSLNDVEYKCLTFPYKDGYVMFPLRHSLKE